MRLQNSSENSSLKMLALAQKSKLSDGATAERSCRSIRPRRSIGISVAPGEWLSELRETLIRAISDKTGFIRQLSLQ
jgi:hypothetical protein